MNPFKNRSEPVLFCMTLALLLFFTFPAAADVNASLSFPDGASAEPGGTDGFSGGISMELSGLPGDMAVTAGDSLTLTAALSAEPGEYLYGWYEESGEAIDEGKVLVPGEDFAKGGIVLPEVAFTPSLIGKFLLQIRAADSSGGEEAYGEVLIEVVEAVLKFEFDGYDGIEKISGAVQTNVGYKTLSGEEGVFQFAGISPREYRFENGLLAGEYSIEVFAPSGYEAEVENPVAELALGKDDSGRWICEALVKIVLKAAESGPFSEMLVSDGGGGERT
ncbi:MAG: hypothetical protein LBC56_00745 [Oscillospiraceae bacterium]|jgi:hypothetical protein|nr:hypothetical protein [Oscillospiraceae bacterium]